MSAKGRPPIVCRACGESAPPGVHPQLDWCPVYDQEAAVLAGWSRNELMAWECGRCAPQVPGSVAPRSGVATKDGVTVAVCIGDRVDVIAGRFARGVGSA